ncbi:MAG: CAP domain-containing protein [Bacteroidota bacterium]|nr:CAP domain-containing protein [Bacteroidota bacterium]
MKIRWYFSGLITLFGIFPMLMYSQPGPAIKKQLPAIVLSPAEKEIIHQVNEYRKEQGLNPVRVSLSLTYVAQCHVHDLAGNHPDSRQCNLHSWSNDGSWSPCCYTGDHKEAPCMWNKPRELTNYDSEGYEIAYWTDEPLSAHDFALKALKGWKRSTEHNNVILNRSMWKEKEWKAVGAGYYEGYAVVWFGEIPDNE